MIRALIERIRSWFVGNSQQTLADWLQRSVGEGVTTPTEALSIPAVWRAVHLVSSSVAQVPLHLYQHGDDRRRQDDAPEARLLQRPTPGVTQYTFRRTLTLHVLLCGDGFAWIYRRRGRPERLVVLDPLQTEPKTDGNALVWETRLEDQTRLLPDRDVLHLCGLSWDGMRGLSPIWQFALSMDLQRCIRDHARGFFLRGTMLSGILKTPRPLTPEERAIIKQSFEQQHGGAGRSWGVAVLGGGLEWQPAVVEPQKTQLAELHQLATRDIAAMFGVPPHKLGDPSRTSYASLEQENLDYLMFSLESWLSAWEAELNAKLCPPDCYWEHNRNALVRSVYSDRVNGYYRMVEMGVLSPNEVRRLENLPERQGGDVYYVPANWIGAGSNPAQAASSSGRD